MWKYILWFWFLSFKICTRKDALRDIYILFTKKKKTPLPGSLSLSNVYTSHLEGGLRLALYDSLFIWGVLAYRALWRYNPHYTRLIPPPNVSARHHHRQGKTEESNRGYLQGIYGSNTSFQDDNQLLPRLRFHISSSWRTCFLFFCLGEKKKEFSGAKENRHKGTYISCNPL